MIESRIIFFMKIIQLVLGTAGIVLLTLGSIEFFAANSFRLPMLLLGLGLALFIFGLLLEAILFEEQLVKRIIYSLLMITQIIFSYLMLSKPEMWKLKILSLAAIITFAFWGDHLLKLKQSGRIFRFLNIVLPSLLGIAILFDLAYGWYWTITAVLIPIYLGVGIYACSGKLVDKRPKPVDAI